MKVEGHPKVRPCHRIPIILPSIACTATVNGIGVAPNV